MYRKLLTTTFLLFAIIATAQAGDRNSCRVGEPAISHETLALLEDGSPKVDAKLAAHHGVAREAIDGVELVLWTPYVKPVVPEAAPVARPNVELARRPRSLHGFSVEQ